MKRLLASCLLVASSVGAQTADTNRAQPALQRARQLNTDGRPADARRLLDSVLKATTPDQPLYADALYWRAVYASTAADAERDYRRLLIEAPLSSRAEEALLRLADLHEARGDRRGATEHLQRFMLSYARNPERPRVALRLVRLLFDQGPQQVARACEAMRVAREEIPAGNAEMRNQLDYYAPRCATVEVPTAPPAVADSAPAPAAQDTARPSPSRPTTPARSATPTAFYSVQVAAYDSAEPATRLANLLVSRGLEARVDGTARPFRVRVGRFGARADAVKAAASLKAQGYNGFITIVSAPRR